MANPSANLRSSPPALKSLLPIVPQKPLHVRPRFSSFSLSSLRTVLSPRVLLFAPVAAARSDVDGSLKASEDVVDDVDGVMDVELELIDSEEQFDRVIDDAKHCGEMVVVFWMANWCRKCIFLKPKLEKLAAAYHPRIKFYCINVNAVPQRLVTRAGVTKMPTIQLWKDSEKQNEVIGGHKAWLVVEDVRNMIENED